MLSAVPWRILSLSITGLLIYGRSRKFYNVTEDHTQKKECRLVYHIWMFNFKKRAAHRLSKLDPRESEIYTRLNA